jgi:hypothetical protein
VAQTRRRRRRKHRGTQSGRIDSRPRGRPRNRAEAKARASSRSSRARSRRQPALTPPTWRSAIVKGAIAALLFFVLIGVAFGRPLAASAGLAAFLLLFYIPMSYYTDRFFYRRRLRQAEQERLERAQRRAGES